MNLKLQYSLSGRVPFSTKMGEQPPLVISVKRLFWINIPFPYCENQHSLPRYCLQNKHVYWFRFQMERWFARSQLHHETSHLSETLLISTSFVGFKSRNRNWVFTWILTSTVSRFFVNFRNISLAYGKVIKPIIDLESEPVSLSFVNLRKTSSSKFVWCTFKGQDLQGTSEVSYDTAQFSRCENHLFILNA